MGIDGNRIARKIIGGLKNKRPTSKILAAVLVGEDAASESFLRQKERVASQVGINFKLIKFSEVLNQQELEREIEKLSQDENIGGLIIQLPIPEKYNRKEILNKIIPQKDIDNLTGRAKVLQPSVGALKLILEATNFNLKNAKAAVVGSGLLIGTPIANWLRPQVKKLSVMKKGEFDSKILAEADLVISGTGVPNLIKGVAIKENALVIDYGYGKIGDDLVGDVEIESVKTKTDLVTPTPGGTGPIVVACLLKNFFELNS